MKLTLGSWRSGVALGVAALLLSGCLRSNVEYFASDSLGGRDNGSAGSALAQAALIDELQQWAVGANGAASGRAAFQQPFTGGTNIVGIIPGTDLASQYVMIGAHYDGHGSDSSCAGKSASDSICNGATDNAAGAAVVLDVAKYLAEGPTRPRRSVIVALWDREEDGLLGSQAYVAAPLVPLASTVAYVNLDIQGANLRPSLRKFTFAVGAETGGPVLVDAVTRAAAPGPLTTEQFSLVFGEGRSDHAVLVNAGVPSVFLTDSTGPCYHTVDDEVGVVDFTKLDAQLGTARRLTLDLATRAATPTLTTGLPLATFHDAQVLQVVGQHLGADLSTFSTADQTTITGSQATVDSAVAGGPANFTNTVMTSVLLAAQSTVTVLTHGPCDGFLAPS